MSILCSNDVYAQLEILMHRTKGGACTAENAAKSLLKIIIENEDGDMLSETIKAIIGEPEAKSHQYEANKHCKRRITVRSGEIQNDSKQTPLLPHPIGPTN